jgi:hypothetical protein
MNSGARKRVRARLQRGRAPDRASSLNTYLTTILAIATLAIAFAQYRVSQKQTEISDALADLEFAKAQPDFNVDPSAKHAQFHQGNKLFINQPPLEAKITLASGLLKFWNASGQVTMFFSNPKGLERCALKIRGTFKQSSRGQLEFIAEKPLQQLIDRASKSGMIAEGFHTNFFVVYGGFVEPISTLNLSLDGSEYEEDHLDAPAVYNGAWSGGRGFYFDEEPAEDYCPALRSRLVALIKQTGGNTGEDYANLSPAQRSALGLP